MGEHHEVAALVRRVLVGEDVGKQMGVNGYMKGDKVDNEEVDIDKKKVGRRLIAVTVNVKAWCSRLVISCRTEGHSFLLPPIILAVVFSRRRLFSPLSFLAAAISHRSHFSPQHLYLRLPTVSVPCSETSTLVTHPIIAFFHCPHTGPAGAIIVIGLWPSVISRQYTGT